MEISVTLHGRDRFAFRQLDMAYLFLFMGVIVAGIQGGLIGRLVTRLGEKRVIIVGAGAFTLGFALVPSIWRLPLLYVVAFFIAIGQGLCYPALTSLVSKAAPENERGSILGLATSAGSLARFLGPLLSGVLYDLAGAAGAFGALGTILALSSGGKPIYVMPLIFGSAPVVNTLTGILAKNAWSQISEWFLAGLILVAVGAVVVLVFQPPGGKPHPKVDGKKSDEAEIEKQPVTSGEPE